jgi:hypothetical protein
MGRPKIGLAMYGKNRLAEPYLSFDLSFATTPYYVLYLFSTAMLAMCVRLRLISIINKLISSVTMLHYWICSW